MHFYTFVMKNVGRRRVRSLLTILGMAIAVGAVVALVGIATGFENSFMSIYQRQNVDLIVQQKNVRDKLTSRLPESAGERIAAIPGVHEVNTGLVDLISMEGAGPVGVLLQGWPADAPTMQRLDIISGDRLSADDKRGVLLGESLAAKLDKKVGDKVNVFGDEETLFTIVGIYRGASVFEDGSMVMLLGELQEFMKAKGQVSGFTVVLDRPGDEKEIARVKTQIQGFDKRFDVASPLDLVQNTGQLQLVRAMSWVTSVIALIIGAVGMLNTMVMSVFERTKEIGILRAIGWRKSRVMRMILLEALILSITGGVVGTTLAILMTRLLGSLPWASGMVSKEIPNIVIFQGFAIAILVGVLGAAYPAYRGAQLHPTEALRHE
jgi:putative ABC transport system permease protein